VDVIVVTTLKELREVRKITLKELAGSLGITVAQASYLENGKRALSLDKAAKMAEIYNTTIDNIYKLVKNQEMMEHGKTYCYGEGTCTAAGYNARCNL